MHHEYTWILAVTTSMSQRVSHTNSTWFDHIIFYQTFKDIQVLWRLFGEWEFISHCPAQVCFWLAILSMSGKRSWSHSRTPLLDRCSHTWARARDMQCHEYNFSVAAIWNHAVLHSVAQFGHPFATSPARGFGCVRIRFCRMFGLKQGLLSFLNLDNTL